MLTEEIKKTAEDIAKEYQASKAAKSENKEENKTVEKKEETQDASPESTPEIKKTEEIKPDDKTEEVKDKKDEKAVEPKKELSENAQRRWDKLTGELKALRYDKQKNADKIRELEDRLDQLSKAAEQPKQVSSLVQKEQERIKRYEEEDKGKAKFERREMSREELEDWLVEDMVAAQEWLADRQIRRRQEREADQHEIKNQENSQKVQREQKASQDRVLEQHPELDTSRRIAELESEGHTKAEIRKLIFKENPKIRTMAEIMAEDPEKAKVYLSSADGPERLMREMEKRLGAKAKKSSDDSDFLSEIADEAAEAERQRQSEVDANSASTRGGRAEKEVSDFYKQQLALFLKAGKTKDDLDRALARRKRMGLD